MNKHSHLEFAFLTNFYNGSMAIKRVEYPLCLSISKTIYLCSIISISHFLIFFNLFCVKKQNSTYEKSSFIIIQLKFPYRNSNGLSFLITLLKFLFDKPTEERNTIRHPVPQPQIEGERTDLKIPR